MAHAMNAARQSTAVAIGARAVLIEGAPGTGKSSLALALIDRGAMLIGDDGVLVEPHDGNLLVRPHPNTRGLIEVRGLGLIDFPVREEAPAALVILLDPQAPRFIEEAGSLDIAGISLPMVRLAPHAAVLPIVAELALARYGLSPG
jgi:serine kinase of HPr protein (carbohydrate metabolism regulator)